MTTPADPHHKTRNETPTESASDSVGEPVTQDATKRQVIKMGRFDLHAELPRERIIAVQLVNLGK